ncbi:PqqD family protein [Pyxidicoccus xibeiensis]|uniref:PqqD family protein n=1 Tax=Pyxidicoccus xibeiensis TaxID=2906759 RepID=UPI0020A7825E|nr:PqqD family protein [Pyxidicoccus xibeiensis]MCP3144285.1 PqqD family protein [Pyxidicoccus xibeiensis]
MGDLMEAVPRLHPAAAVQRVRGQLVVLGPDETLHTFEDDTTGTVSEVAERIVELVDGRRTVGDIAAVLCEEFEVEGAVCRHDTSRFVALLVERQVLVLGATAAGSSAPKRE